MGAVPMPRFKETAQEKKERERFEAEDDLRTLNRADEIRHSTSRMSRAKRFAQRQLNAAKTTVRKLGKGRSGKRR